jgi:hypothetical protein
LLCRPQAMVVTKLNGFGRKDRLFVAARVSPRSLGESPTQRGPA